MPHRIVFDDKIIFDVQYYKLEGESRLNEGVKKPLNELRQAGYSLYAVSDYDHDDFNKRILSAGLSGIFNNYFGQSKDGPSKRSFLQFLRDEAERERKSVVYISNFPDDMSVAKELKIVGVGVFRTLEVRDRLTESGAKKTYATLRDAAYHIRHAVNS